MKLKEKLVIAVVILPVLMLFVAGNAFARMHRQPPTASEIIAHMKQELNLTDQQISQIQPLIENEISKIKELRSTAEEQARSQIKTLHQETRQEISKYLTSDQLAKWKSESQREGKGRGSQGGQGGGNWQSQGRNQGMGQGNNGSSNGSDNY